MKLDNLSSKNNIDYIKGLFSRYGIPDEIITDNGPQFSSAEFQQFAQKSGFIHATSSPRFPQANGQAERAIQTVKRLVKKSDDPHKALLDYRNTPLDIGYSPAQLFLGRRLKTSLPTSAPLLQPQGLDLHEVNDRLKTRQIKAKFYHDRHSGKDLKPLKIGESVVMATGDKKALATVIKRHDAPRSYILQSRDGRIFRRNRKHLQPASPSGHHDPIPNFSHFPKSVLNDNSPPNTMVTEGTRKETTVDSPSKSRISDIPGDVPLERNEKCPVMTRSVRIVKSPAKYHDFVE